MKITFRLSKNGVARGWTELGGFDPEFVRAHPYFEYLFNNMGLEIGDEIMFEVLSFHDE